MAWERILIVLVVVPCDGHFDFNEMFLFFGYSRKLVIPDDPKSLVPRGVEPLFRAIFQVVVDLGLCETCCSDSPCGPAGAFAEYALALAETVAKRDGLSSKDLVGLPLAGHGCKNLGELLLGFLRIRGSSKRRIRIDLKRMDQK